MVLKQRFNHLRSWHNSENESKRESHLKLMTSRLSMCWNCDIVGALLLITWAKFEDAASINNNLMSLQHIPKYEHYCFNYVVPLSGRRLMFCINHIAVSYTHLDVYKRQRLTGREQFRLVSPDILGIQYHTNLIQNSKYNHIF